MSETYMRKRQNLLVALLNPPRFKPIPAGTPPLLRWKKEQGRLQQRHEYRRYRRSQAYIEMIRRTMDALKAGRVDSFVGFEFVRTNLIVPG